MEKNSLAEDSSNLSAALLDSLQQDSDNEDNADVNLVVGDEGEQLQSGASRTWWNALNIFNRLAHQKRTVQYTALGTDESKLIPTICYAVEFYGCNRIYKKIKNWFNSVLVKQAL